MKKFYSIKRLLGALLAVVVLQSCTKNVEAPQPSTTSDVPVVTDSRPRTNVSVTINAEPMNVTSVDFNRGSNTLFIRAGNALQKTELSVSHFYQTNPFSYICNYEVTYYDRADSLNEWNKYPINRDTEDLYFQNFMPMKDSIVTGYFGVTYADAKKNLAVKANFKLVF